MSTKTNKRRAGKNLEGKRRRNINHFLSLPFCKTSEDSRPLSHSTAPLILGKAEKWMLFLVLVEMLIREENLEKWYPYTMCDKTLQAGSFLSHLSGGGTED